MEYRIPILVAAVLLAAAGCQKKSACAGGDVAVEISGNHGHAVEIPANAVQRGIAGTYRLKGGDHEHAIALKDADFAALNEGKAVTTRATSVEGHTHEVRLRCVQR